MEGKRDVGKLQRIRHDSAYRSDIDGLRAVSIGAVLLYHLFPARVPGGFVGVDIFFVISGYLIAGMISADIERGTFSFLNFYGRRIRRLLPALICVLGACLAVGWYFLLPGEYAVLGTHVAASVGFVENFVLHNESGYFDTSIQDKPVMHLWSLAVEEQFYLFYPIALYASLRMGISALSTTAGILVVSFIANLLRVSQHPVEAFFLPHARFWEIMVGACLAFAKPGSLRPSSPMAGTLANPFSAFGISAIIGSVLLVPDVNSFPGVQALAPTLGAALVISAGSEAWINKKLLSNSPVVFLGLISYPLYLWHWPLLSFFHIYDPSYLFARQDKFVILAASLALAYLTYRYVELPIRYGGNGFLKAASLVPPFASLGLFAVVASLTAGFPARTPLAGVPERAGPDFFVANRYKKCLLDPDAPADDYDKSCVDPPNGKKLVFIWGDSYSASLYPGLKRVFGDTVRFAQFSRGSCPAILGLPFWQLGNIPICAENNRRIVAAMVADHADEVIIYSYWEAYSADWSPASKAGEQLISTIQKLKQSGIRNILVIGPAPLWPGGLVKVLMHEWQRTHYAHPPERMSVGLSPATRTLDKEMRSLVTTIPEVSYFSAYAAFCDARGCLTRLAGDDHKLPVVDSGHLSLEGAIFLARQLPRPES